MISEENVRVVKEAIEMKNNKFCFKRIKIEKVLNIEALEYILKSIGEEIEYLSIEKTVVFQLLKGNAVNLKSLEMNFDGALANSINDGSFDLQFLPLLEELSFKSNGEMTSTTNKLLKQIKSTKNTSFLKHLELVYRHETEEYLMDSLLQHSSTLESLELVYHSYNDIKNYNKWKIPFSHMKNLKKFLLVGYHTEMMDIIFNALPNETSLEHLQLAVYNDFDYNKLLPLIAEKWMNSLQYLLLANFRQLTDVDAMELRKLSKLRVLKLSACYKITKMGLLASMAKEQNIFMDELYLDDIPKLDESSFVVIISRFPNLRVLTLKNLGSAITNISLQSIWRFSNRLRNLCIKSAFDITVEGFIGFGNEPYSINRLRHLVKLTLDNCYALTDRILIEALKLPALRSLQLIDCPKITLKGIESLVKSCQLLEFLSLPRTLFINDDVSNENALFVIGNLRQLKITGCNFLPEKVRDHIKDVFIALQNSSTNTTFSPDCKLILEINTVYI